MQATQQTDTQNVLEHLYVDDDDYLSTFDDDYEDEYLGEYHRWNKHEPEESLLKRIWDCIFFISSLLFYLCIAIFIVLVIFLFIAGIFSMAVNAVVIK